MKVVLQKVSEGSVSVNGTVIGSIGNGVVLLCGFGIEDNEKSLQWMVDKLCRLKVFGRSLTSSPSPFSLSGEGGSTESVCNTGDIGKDEADCKSERSSFMEQSLLDVKGEVLIVSQFTVYANCRKGAKPSFTHAAPIDEAKELYMKFVEMFKKTGLKVETGEFQAIMQISLVNDGPLTLVIEN
jgi:D-aminoacyl-tRNA deacylase